MVPWTVAVAVMALAAAWLGVGLRVVGDDLPGCLAGRARWWRRWAWPVAAGCAASACAGTATILLC